MCLVGHLNLLAIEDLIAFCKLKEHATPILLYETLYDELFWPCSVNAENDRVIDTDLPVFHHISFLNLCDVPCAFIKNVESLSL